MRIGGESSLILAFCEPVETPELAACTWHHWTAEIITVKMISSSRLKPHGTEWSRYICSFLLHSVGDDGGLLEPGIWQHCYPRWTGRQRDLVAQGVTFDTATCEPARGVLTQGIFGFILLFLLPLWRLFFSCTNLNAIGSTAEYDTIR